MVDARERYYGRLWRLTPQDPAMMHYFREQRMRRVQASVQDARDEVASREPSESDALLEVGETPGIKPLQVAINIVKCAVGAGSFSVPNAFKQEGIWAGLVTCVVLGLLSAYTITLLARAEKYFVKKSASKQRLTYPEVARHAFPRLTFKGVNVVEVLVYVGLCLCSIGVCAVYAVFIILTFPQVVSVSQTWVALAVGIMMLGMALLRSFHYLTFTSILGDVAVACGIIATIAFGIKKCKTFDDHLPAIHPQGIPQATATLAFLFLIHAIVLPMSQSLEGDMDDPDKFDRIAWYSHIAITLLNGVFGILCYMLFGPETEGNIIQNLDKGVVLSMVRVLLCVDLLFTVPMVLAFGREIIENSLFAAKFSKAFCERHEDVARTLVRTFLVLVITAMAVGLVNGSGNDAFSNLITLVGGGTNIVLGLVLPPMLHLTILREQKVLRAKLFSVAGNVVIVILGLVLFFSSTYYTIDAMAHPPPQAPPHAHARC